MRRLMRVTSLVDGTVGEEIEGIRGRALRDGPAAARRQVKSPGLLSVVAGGLARSGAAARATSVRMSLIPASAGDVGDRAIKARR